MTDQPLTPAQLRAIAHTRNRARLAQPAARRRLSAALWRVGMDDALAPLLAGGGERGVVVLTFHPDRIAGDGRTVSQSLLDDGIYRSQFETKISAGGLSAYPGGDRERWEELLFAGAYSDPLAADSERLKYGGLDLLGFSDGPCPRFGSCQLRLSWTAMARTTFCLGDSHDQPSAVGTIDVFDAILADLIEETERTGAALGCANTSTVGLVQLLTTGASGTQATPGRALDEYIEAQVHGPVHLGADVDALVADPSFRSTEVGTQLAEIAARYCVELRWNGGFEMAAADVPSDFRGPAIPPLAVRVAAEFGDGTGRINAEIVGRAARSLVTDPGHWAGMGNSSDTTQHLKQLWHVLVRYGHPAS